MLPVKDIHTAPTKHAGIFNQISLFKHEQVVFCNDPELELKCIIAIHNTTLGPALGGTRFFNYKSEEEALLDVLRLSRGMTYKASIAGVNLGGGKAVIIGDTSKLRSEALFKRYGKFIETLGGQYITAQDVGTGTEDMEYISRETNYVTGKPEALGGGGSPSPFTAYGTYLGIKACAKEVWGKDELKGKSILVEGVGHVGSILVDYLVKEGAKVFISDIDENKLRSLQSKNLGIPVDLDSGYDLDIDIYSPCALGATLNAENIERLKCTIVAGAANNQLEDEFEHSELLKEKGILYAPDFLINAGGIINCYTELQGYDKNKAHQSVEPIYDRTLSVFNYASQHNITTHKAAMVLAEKRIEDGKKLNSN